MNVAELRDSLADFPQDLPVYVMDMDGWNDGWDETEILLSRFKIRKISREIEYFDKAGRRRTKSVKDVPILVLR